MSRLVVNSQFRLNVALRAKHDYRQDSAFNGAYLMRLPDRTLVPAEEYERRLAVFLERRNRRRR